MKQNGGKPKKNLLFMVGGIAGVVTIITLFITVLQLWQSLVEAKTQERLQSNLLTISENQLAAQQTLIAVQQNPSSDEKISDIKATIVVLENERIINRTTLTPGFVFETNTSHPSDTPTSTFLPSYTPTSTQPIQQTTTAPEVVFPTNTPLPSETPTIIPSPGLLFEDNFNDGNSEGWIPLIGSWNVVEGSYLCVASHYAETSYVDGLWTDYSVSADVKPFSGTVDISVMGRWQDMQNYYMAQLIKGEAHLTRREHGHFSILAIVPYTSKNGTWYKIRLDFQGTKIKMYVDNTLILSVEDGVFLRGKMGVRCASNSQAYFDNVKVASIPNQ